MCGGTRLASRRRAAASGLSPRVRGNQRHYQRNGQNPGSIPACAGEPGKGVARQSGHRVYPRVCGGTAVSSVGSAANLGLSPRVRGNRDKPVHGVAEDGSIPACAGEPAGVGLLVDNTTVYPRVCGGTGCQWGCRGLPPGLSPRVRGNQESDARSVPSPGSIPACAGEPLCHLLSVRAVKVYPRVCGGTSAFRWAACC